MFYFNDALNTFYLRLYGVRHMVKDHSDSEKGNLLPPHRLLFPINSKGSFICRQDNTYHSLCYTSRGALAGTRNSSMGSPHEGLIRRPIASCPNQWLLVIGRTPLVLKAIQPSVHLRCGHECGHSETHRWGSSSKGGKHCLVGSTGMECHVGLQVFRDKGNSVC